MRAYASRLAASFEASAQIEHRVTKGESREHQILDVLDALLPNKISVGRNVVVIDRADTESPKFDGVIFDRMSLPLLHEDGGVSVAMIESVCYCIEVKSGLATDDLRDIFRKSDLLRSMASVPGGIWAEGPVVTGFGYRAENINLSFFDYAIWFALNKLRAPAPICILNQAVFTAVKPTDNSVSICSVPTEDSVAALLPSGADSLLVYFYLLLVRLAEDSSVSDILLAYSPDLLDNQTAFRFDRDFLDRVGNDDRSLSRARDCFKGSGHRDIMDVYRDARTALAL
jgi:hypothetical protein